MPKKLLISSKSNLTAKYGQDFSKIDSLLKDIVTVDKSRSLETLIIYIDDPASATAAGITAVGSITRRLVKQAVDELYEKHLPVYITIFGAADIIPFQELANPVPNSPTGNDSDATVPSDLPYACNAPYSTIMGNFTGPSRVVGRIPDITGKADLDYVKTVVKSIIDYTPKSEEDFQDYFAVTAEVWEKSTRQTLINLFGNTASLLNSPPAEVSYPEDTLKPLTHFYNCHGAPEDAKFYGQRGNNFPVAMESSDLHNKVSFGTVVAAECCYGAELYNPANEGTGKIGIANQYLGNGAIAFVGSSTIAYGPPVGQGLADLITQYFIKHVLSGASTGRAFLEAQQRFLAKYPTMEPFELKTLGQFYLLGDPSLQVVKTADSKLLVDSIENRRLNLSKKGNTLEHTVEVCKQVKAADFKKTGVKTEELKTVFDETGFTGTEKEFLYEIKPKIKNNTKFTKAMLSDKAINFRIFVKDSATVKKNLKVFEVLVLKESNGTLLGWKVYHRKS